MPDDAQVQIKFTRDTEYGPYSDALWLSMTDYQGASPEYLEALKDARAAAYVNAIKHPAHSTPAPQPVVDRVISKLDFRRRFTQQEQIACDNFATSALADEQKAVVRTIYNTLRDATEVHLDSVECVQGTNILEDFGLIGPGRAAQILA